MRRLFFDGPVAGTTGLYLTRAFDGELLKIGKRAERVLWRISTAPRLFEFRVAFSIRPGLVVGGGARGAGAFDEETGRFVWTTLEVTGGFSLKNCHLWCATADPGLIELDLETGHEVRRIDVPEGRVIGSSDKDGVLGPKHALLDEHNRERELAKSYCSVLLERGEVLWKRNLAQQAWEAAGQSPHFVTNLVPGSLGESWIGRWRESTFACSRKDGSLVWLARDVACGIRAATKEGRVFGMPVGGGRFYVLDERTGALLAQHDGSGLEGAAYPGIAAFLGEYVVYGMESGHLAVFDPRDGRLVWAKRHKAPLSDVRVIDGRVYVTTGKGELLVYEPTVPIE